MKKICLMALSLVLVAALSIGGTLAYLTDRDNETNVFTVGNVDIELNEDFEQGAELLPGKYIDKVPTIENVGSNDAWVWMTFAIPSALDNWNQGGGQDGSYKNIIHWNPLGATHEGYVTEARVAKAIEDGYLTAGTTVEGILTANTTWDVLNNKLEYQQEINGMMYNVYVLQYNKALTPGEETLPTLYNVYMDAQIDIDPEGDWYRVVAGEVTPVDWNVKENGNPVLYVNAYAIQADQFANIDEAYAAYVGQWGTLNGTYELPTAGEVADTSWYNSAETEFKVDTAEEVAGFAKLVNEGTNFSGKTVVLDADIDLGGVEWTPIGQTGSSYGATGYFMGNFDGQGHTIKGLNITQTNEGGNYAAGFFGFLDCGQNGTIKNVTFDGANVAGHHWTGVVAGYLSGNMENVKVINSTVICTHVNDDACGDKAGAVVGYINGIEGKITNCSATDCTVTAGRDAGQVVGCAKASQVVGCSATNVTVTAGGDCTGANIKNEVLGRAS